MSDLPELTSVRTAHQFSEENLKQYLSKNLSQELDLSNLSVSQFEGGQSNPTFLLDFSNEKMVLRKQPPGTLLKSAHQVDREYKVMAALGNTDVAVPKMILFCDDSEIIGTSFYIMEYVDGRVITDRRLVNFSRSQRGQLIDSSMKNLAAMHLVDVNAVGLKDFGRPGNYFERQISRWTKQYRASETEDLSEMNQLIDWLPKNIPAEDESCLVHGDYRIGNVVVHPTEPKVIATLDWELSTLGHPLADLGHFCLMYYTEREADFNWSEAGFPTVEELCDIYCRYAGREKIQTWNFYVVYSLFRIAAIMQGVYKRGLDGNASSEKWRTQREGCEFASKQACKIIAMDKNGK